MQDAIAAAGRAGRIFQPTMLDSVRELNHRFLDLVGPRRRRWDPAASRAVCSAAAVAGRWRRCRAPRRRPRRDCPYALFDLRFRMRFYWQSRLARAVHGSVADEPAADADRVDFRAAGAFLRLARGRDTANLAAQFLLGMTPGHRGALSRRDVNCLPALAASEAAQLDRAMEPLRRLLERADRRRVARRMRPHLRRIQLYGLQLAAAARLP